VSHRLAVLLIRQFMKSFEINRLEAALVQSASNQAFYNYPSCVISTGVAPNPFECLPLTHFTKWNGRNWAAP
jgi:hypothetical protein